MSFKEEYHTLWNWLLDKGILIASIIVNFFLATIFAIAMVGLYFLIKWWSKH
jgi:hypothetical protein